MQVGIYKCFRKMQTDFTQDRHSIVSAVELPKSVPSNWNVVLDKDKANNIAGNK